MQWKGQDEECVRFAHPDMGESWDAEIRGFNTGLWPKIKCARGIHHLSPYARDLLPYAFDFICPVKPFFIGAICETKASGHNKSNSFQ
jgi:hypothetical protein